MNTPSTALKPMINITPWGFLAGLVVGSLAGAGTMMLLAPQSGKRTRAQIRLKGLELREQASEAVDDAVSQTRAKAHEITVGVRERAKELQQSGQEVLNEQRERVAAIIGAVGKQPVHAHAHVHNGSD